MERGSTDRGTGEAREEVVVAVAEMNADDDASTLWFAVHRRAATANWESAPATSGSAPGRGGR